ncbi:DNA polymerase delta subunit 4 [Talaromyces islandicus]|uniref:DNA polymerase delta subunit 4 n=1 Tax=Talaromyces islandicus TaxID=28573 RepID=A0A0U1LLI7_TALIS|nr:DNA polymerase delta subunit 4 [Talaromyces islandicus]
MPPRRTTGRATGRTAGQQSTLSFSNSRVTKPTATAPGKQIKETIANAPHVVPVVTTPEPPVADDTVVVPEKEKDELDEAQTDEDSRALKVTESALRNYWAEEERRRSAPRVHQKDLSVDEKILRHFDLSSQYGPCIGISRIRRWRRAQMLDLNPPIEVLAVLLKERKAQVNEHAYVDELLS